MLNFKKVVSIICTIAIVLTLCIVPVNAATTVTVTMNNNGTITTQELTPGTAMPVADDNSLGESFCGWYTDCVNWDSQTLTLIVPNSDTTVYARYPTTVINFNQIQIGAFAKGVNAGSSYDLNSIKSGIYTFRTWSQYNQGTYIPAYDAPWSSTSEFSAYQIKPSTTYTIKMYMTSDIGGQRQLNMTTLGDTWSSSDLWVMKAGNLWNSANSYETYSTGEFTTAATLNNGNTNLAFYSSYIANWKNNGSITYKIDTIYITDSSVTVPDGFPVTITTNNNGTISEQSLIPGDAMPNPGENELGEEFIGWYTDCITWDETTLVTTVPEEATTVYARYPSVIINFTNNMTSGMNVKGTYLEEWSIGPTITNGVLNFEVYANKNGFTIPAYDMATFTPFTLSETGNYSIKMYIAATIDSTTYPELKFAIHNTPLDAPFSSTVAEEDNYYATSTASITASTDYQEYGGALTLADVADRQALIFKVNKWSENLEKTNSSNPLYHLYFDKIVITDNSLTSSTTEDPYIGWASIREKTAEVNTGIRFRARASVEKIESAINYGFLVCPTRLILSGSTPEEDLVIDSANSNVLRVISSDSYAETDEYKDYQLCIRNLIGSERGVPDGRDFRTDYFSVVFYIKTDECVYYSTPKATSFEALGGNTDSTVTVTLNDNGTITTESLTVGTSIPSPTSTSDYGDFLGWYTDPDTWTNQVTTVPESDITLYAKYQTIYIDFNNIETAVFETGISIVEPSSYPAQYYGIDNSSDNCLEVKSGAAYNTGFVIPAYDGAWSDSTEYIGYKLESGVSYTVNVPIISDHNTYVKLVVVDETCTQIDTAPAGTGSDTWMYGGVETVTEYKTLTYEFTATDDHDGYYLAVVNCGTWSTSTLGVTWNYDSAASIMYDKISVTNNTLKEDSANITLNGNTYSLTFSDTFNGTELDSTKWTVYEMERQNLGGWWDESMVEVKDGSLYLNTGYDTTNNRVISGCIDSYEKFTQSYGYWEASIKFPAAKFWGAFWLVCTDVSTIGNGGSDGAEIDIFESTHGWDGNGTGQHNVVWDGYGSNSNSIGATYTGAEQNIYDGNFHTYAIEWTDTYYKFYIDGDCTLTVDKNHSKWSEMVGTASTPARILFSIEYGTANGAYSSSDTLTEADTGLSMVVDYVKVYELVE